MKFHSNGKLLISGEYVVMNGALALATPVKFGQTLTVKQNRKNILMWKTFVNNKLWFSANFNNNLFCYETNNKQTAGFVEKLLKSAQSLNPQFFTKAGFDIRTDIRFDINWGLGSSSTLINNIAQWAKINPFSLFFKTANGSAYDIACASSNKPLLYQLKNGKPEYRQINFYPDFHQNIYFAYLGQKQKSDESIVKFKKEAVFSEKDIAHISEITKQMLKTNSLTDFSALINKHEQILSGILNQKPVKEKYFGDFQGAVKSLGAWGGDFIMIASKLPFEQIKTYFSKKGINIIFTFEKMIKHS